MSFQWKEIERKPYDGAPEYYYFYKYLGAETRQWKYYHESTPYSEYNNYRKEWYSRSTYYRVHSSGRRENFNQDCTAMTRVWQQDVCNDHLEDQIEEVMKVVKEHITQDLTEAHQIKLVAANGEIKKRDDEIAKLKQELESVTKQNKKLQAFHDNVLKRMNFEEIYEESDTSAAMRLEDSKIPV